MLHDSGKVLRGLGGWNLSQHFEVVLAAVAGLSILVSRLVDNMHLAAQPQQQAHD